MTAGSASMMQLKNENSLTEVFKVTAQAPAMDTADAQELTAFAQSPDKEKEDDDDFGAPAGYHTP